MFDPAAIAAFRAHALEEHPREACGLVTSGGYARCVNLADDPTEAFEIHPEVLMEHAPVLAVCHSHTHAEAVPSAADMEGQLATGLPWGLCATDGERVSEPWFWGAGVAPPPLLGREFRHGPSGSDGRGDCYALIRDWFHVERGIDLPEFARDREWWLAGGDLYRDGFAAAGFERVDGDPRPGDVLLGQIRSPVPNHGAVYLGDGLMLHHLEHRLSAREPVGGWRKHLTHVLRHRSLA